MSLLQRIKDLGSAHIYAAIEKAEDPRVMVDQYIRNFESEIEKAQDALATQVAFEVKYKRQLSEATEMLNLRTQQAEGFARAGKADKVKEAVELKASAQQKVNEYQKLYDDNKALADQARAQVEELQKELNKLRDEKDILIARAESAEARTSINKTLSTTSSDSATAGLERMRNKVEKQEAMAEATGEVFKKEKSIDEEFAELQKNSAVDDEVARLMAQFGNKE